MSKRKWDNETFIQAVNTSLSYAEVIRKQALKQLVVIMILLKGKYLN